MNMDWSWVDEAERARVNAVLARHTAQPRMSDLELRRAIETATGEQRADLIAEAIRRINTYPRAWLPWDAAGLTA
jgi:hypothetical protein